MRRAGLFLTLVAALCGCAGSAVQPRILVLDYRVSALSDAAAAKALVEALGEGRTTIERVLGPGGFACNYAADFSNQSRSGSSVNGTLGQPSFNVRLAVVAAPNLTTTNPAACPVVGDVVISVGGVPLAPGQATNRTSGEFTFADGRAFTSGGYAEARFNAFDSASGYTSGDFRYAKQLAPDSPVVLLVVGSFALRP